MSPRELFIELQSSVRTYFPGQIIVGRVVTTFTKPEQLINISITFEGKAKVNWQETTSTTARAAQVGISGQMNIRNEAAHYNAEEHYFTSKVLLLGGDSGTMTLPEATTYYPFQFTLPNNIPSSFTSRDGTVEYFMQARLKRSWYKLDITEVVPFMVNGVVDLNTEFGADIPVDLYMEKFAGCFCCKSGPIAFKATMPRQGFVPGEVLPLHLDLTNISKRRVSRTKVSLVQLVTYHARGKSRQLPKVMAEAFGPGVSEGDTESWDGSMIQIPVVPPTKLGGCRIMEVDYEIQIEMDITNAINLYGKVPLKIGTIPFHAQLANSVQPPPEFSVAQPPPPEGTFPVQNFSGYPHPTVGFVYPST